MADVGFDTFPVRKGVTRPGPGFEGDRDVFEVGTGPWPWIRFHTGGFRRQLDGIDTYPSGGGSGYIHGHLVLLLGTDSEMIPQMPASVTGPVIGERAHGVDIGLPTVKTRRPAPTVNVFLNFRFNVPGHLVNDADHTIGAKSGIELVEVAVDEISSKGIVFQQFAQQESGPVRIGPVVVAGLGGKGQGVVGGTVTPDVKTEIQVKGEPAPPSVVLIRGIGIVLIRTQSPEINVIAGPVGVPGKDLSDLVIHEVFDVDTGLDMFEMPLFFHTVAPDVTDRVIIVMTITFFGPCISFEQIDIFRIHTVDPFQVMFVVSFPHIVNAPVLPVQEDDKGPVSLGVERHVPDHLLDDGVPHHGLGPVIARITQHQSIKLIVWFIGKHAVVKPVIAVLIPCVEPKGFHRVCAAPSPVNTHADILLQVGVL